MEDARIRRDFKRGRRNLNGLDRPAKCLDQHGRVSFVMREDVLQVS